VLLEPCCGGIKMGYLQGEADLATDPTPDFELIDSIGLLLVEYLESCPPQVKDEGRPWSSGHTCDGSSPKPSR